MFLEGRGMFKRKKKQTSVFSINDQVRINGEMSSVVLNIENLSIGYESAKSQLILEKGLYVTINQGELVCLIGPNGCGKSTLMRTIAGLQKPLKGTPFIAGNQISKLPPHKYARLLSLVLTDKISVGALTVYDIVSIGRYPYTNRFAKLTDEDNVIIKESIAMVHLENYHNRFYDELSDGEKQRVMIAKALAQDTPLIMLDEPTAHLDLPNRVEIMNILKSLARETNKAILLSTHELDLALQTADSIWLMHRNHDLRHGTPEDLVLNGSFTEVFHANAFDFDMNTGSFKVKHPTYGSVSLVGEGVGLIWTQKALERVGYKVATGKKSDIIITVNDDNTWSLSVVNKEITCGSVGELLSEVRALEVG